jgi:hypothetical protein
VKQYLLSVVEPSTGDMPGPEELGRIMARVDAFEQELKRAGAWVFSGGLCEPSSATTLRPKGEDVLISDGPYVEGKEHLGGFTIIVAPDIDAALEWGRKAVAATTLPVEVRPFRG